MIPGQLFMHLLFMGYCSSFFISSKNISIYQGEVVDISVTAGCFASIET
jgi:hypothetical protein